MKKLITILLLCSSAFARTTYYVSSSLGNDGNPGTSKSSTWKTITKVNSVGFGPGDSILFKAGDIFQGTITIVNSGSAGHPIVIDVYGSGARPQINGLDNLTAWTNTGSGIWSCHDANLGATLNTVTIGGKFQPKGRWPVLATGYRTYTSFSGTASLTDSSLPNSPSFVGAEVVFKKNHFTLSHNPLTAQAGGVISYSGGTGLSPTNNFGYFFQGSAACLSQLGDWYYNPTSKTVYMYFGLFGSPSGYTIQAAYNNVLFTVNNKSYITVNDLDFEGANQYGVNFQNNSNFTLQNCLINNSGVNGIEVNNVTYATITGCTVNNSLNDGIWTFGTTNCNFTHNSIDYSGMVAGAGATDGSAGFGALCGMLLGSGNYNLVQYNSITRCGSNCLYVKGDYVQVLNNYFSMGNQRTDDGGLLYSDGGSSPVLYHFRHIGHNIFDTSPGSPEGTSDHKALGVCIYCDNNSSNWNIFSNVMFGGSQAGYYAHSNHTDTLNQNLFYNNTIGISVVHDGVVAPAATHDMLITGNYVYAYLSTQIVFNLASTASGDPIGNLANWGIASGNHYNNISSPQNVFQTQYFGHSAVKNTFATWKTLTGQDGSSTFSLVTAPTLFYSNSTQLSSNIPLLFNYVDHTGTVRNAPSFTLSPFTGAVLIQTGAPAPSGNTIKVNGYKATIK